MTVYDITRPLGPDTPVWPGDVPVTFEQTMSQSAGDPVSSSAMRSTVHAGTHMDAPCHVVRESIGIDEVALTRCLGMARVVDVGDAAIIGPELLYSLSGVTRVLFKTGCSGGGRADHAAPYTAIAPATATALLDAGVVLVGVDAPSVDPADSEDLPVHQTLLGSRVVVLENLWLGEVVPGDYELIALPLRLVGRDGSPVRAVLRSPESP